MLVCDYYRRMSNDASEAWTLLFRLFVSQRGRVPQVAAEFDLSPMQAHVLRLLEPDQPLPMRTLARNGLEVRRRIVLRLSEAPEPIARLSATDQRALREILNRALEPGL